MLTHGELFAGISGFGSGFAESGIETRWCVEIDPDCRRVLAKHHPGALILDDVRAVGAANLPRVDIISFGSPCQDLSVAGKRAGMKGERSGLFFEAIRIVRELRPTLAVWENVPGAFSSNAGRDFLAVLRAFRECGARDVAWRVLDARHFGVAQRRRRVFLVADFRGERAGEILFESPCGCRHSPARGEAGARVAATVRSRSHGPGVNPPGRGGEDDQNLVFSELGEGHQTYQRADISAATFAEGCGPHARVADVAKCLDSHGGNADSQQGGTIIGFSLSSDPNNWREDGVPPLTRRHNDPGNIQTGMTVRRLTPRECCRLQGFPDDWLDLELPPGPIGEGWRYNQSLLSEKQIQAKLSDSAKYRMLGNAVCRNVAEWIGRRIALVMKDSPCP